MFTRLADAKIINVKDSTNNTPIYYLKNVPKIIIDQCLRILIDRGINLETKNASDETIFDYNYFVYLEYLVRNNVQIPPSLQDYLLNTARSYGQCDSVLQILRLIQDTKHISCPTILNIIDSIFGVNYVLCGYDNNMKYATYAEIIKKFNDKCDVKHEGKTMKLNEYIKLKFGEDEYKKVETLQSGGHYAPISYLLKKNGMHKIITRL
jgi:hypothetical protein